LINFKGIEQFEKGNFDEAIKCFRASEEIKVINLIKKIFSYPNFTAKFPDRQQNLSRNGICRKREQGRGN
jgi:hypothetical protein